MSFPVAGRTRQVVTEPFPHLFSFAPWQQYPLKAFFTGRAYDCARTAPSRYRRTVLRTLGLAEVVVRAPRQIHSRIVFHVRADEPWHMPEGDGVVTAERGVPLAVLTADCVPVFFFDPHRHVVGLVHAGWRGLAAGIVARMLDILSFDYDVRLSTLAVAIGPAVRKCCYVVGPEVARIFPGSIQRQAGYLKLDLVRTLTRQLTGRGVRPEHIVDSGLCTMCLNSQFFSYRAEHERAGRMMSLMMLA